jgi:hypothetical protein
MHVCHPSCTGSINRRVSWLARPKTGDSIQEITKVKGAWGMTHMVECLPSKLEVLGLNPSTAQTKPNKKINMHALCSITQIF